MNHYEMLCILPGTLAEDEVGPVAATAQQVLEKYKAENITAEDLGKSRLAYPVKQIRYGYFRLFHFQLESKELAQVRRDVQIVNNVLRVVIHKYDPSHIATYTLAQDPNALSAPKPEKDFGKRKPMKHQTERRVEKEEITDKQEKGVDIVLKTTEKAQSKPEVKNKPVKKISIDDIDQKLDEILQQDIDKI